jgi:hypothetical protein
VHYNRLREVAGMDALTYLVVFQMPSDEPDWFRCSANQLILKRCLRWVSLRGAPETTQGSITVYLPDRHVLTPEALRKLARSRSLEQCIEYNQQGFPMPTIPDNTLEKFGPLAPRDVQGYVRSRGWQQSKRVGHLMVFNRPEPKSLDQVLVPIDSTRPDFPERMGDAVEKLAAFECRPIAAIVTDLLHYDADVLRFRVVSPRAERGTLPLIQAIDLLAGAKQSLLAAAHSALVRAKYHPQLSRTEARELLEACRMNQTEQGSFVVAISCPMRAFDADEAGVPPFDEPFARRATLLLSRALSSLDRAIEEDRVNSIVDDAHPIVSANLCDALLKMRPAQDNAFLEFRPSWASSTPIRAEEKSDSTSITFSSDDFQAIEEVYRQLRPMEGSNPKRWIAFVDELRGAESDSGAREGEVILKILDDEELIRAKANLTREQYQIAYELHNPTRPLFIVGQLYRGPRMSRLTQIREMRPALPVEVGG